MNRRGLGPALRIARARAIRPLPTGELPSRGWPCVPRTVASTPAAGDSAGPSSRNEAPVDGAMVWLGCAMAVWAAAGGEATGAPGAKAAPPLPAVATSTSRLFGMLLLGPEAADSATEQRYE